MKSLRKVIRTSFVLLNCTLFTSLFANNEPAIEIHASDSKKIYIKLDQLSISTEGMFVNVQGETQPISALFRDTQGLYVMASELTNDGYPFQYQCRNGHPAPMGTGRCNQPDCVYFAGK